MSVKREEECHAADFPGRQSIIVLTPGAMILCDVTQLFDAAQEQVIWSFGGRGDGA